MTKALFCGSFNPWHGGHQFIFDSAIQMFGKENVYIGIGKNSSKSIDANRVKWNMNSVSKNIVVYEGLTADYCKNNGFDLIVRGIRNDVSSLKEESELAFWNNRIAGIRTVFVPVLKCSELSSSAIREIAKYNQDFDSLVKVIPELTETEMPVRRWLNNRTVNYNMIFGKSCSGKSTYLKSLVNKGEIDYLNCDVEFLNYLCETGINSLHSSFISKFKDSFDNDDVSGFSQTIAKVSHRVNWKQFLFSKCTNTKPYYIDCASFGAYYKYIPLECTSQFNIIKVSTSDENRKKFAKLRGKDDGWINKVDQFYVEPPFYDEEIIIQ
jgi:pantetheine-phosphate adenylyltransferase